MFSAVTCSGVTDTLLGVVHEDVGELHDVEAERGGEEHRLPAVEGRAAGAAGSAGP